MCFMQRTLVDMAINMVYYLNKGTIMAIMPADFNGFLKIKGSLNFREGRQSCSKTSHLIGFIL